MESEYNKRDAETTISFFADKPTPILIDSLEKNKIVGKKKIKNLFDKLFSGEKILKIQITENAIFIENNVAVCYLKCDISGKLGVRKIAAHGYHWTVVLKQIDNKWSIILTHFSAVTSKH
ncbi:MAG TPA: nuclear transport factor 2 family protein [bacterium]|nr:nuclear transport factor 2 family protein [bacterium]